MLLSQHDLLTGVTAIIIIAVALICIEIAQKKKQLSKLAGRKMLHFTAVCTCAFAIYCFENLALLAIIFLIFFMLLLWVIRKGWMQVSEHKTYGIALFPLAFAVLLFTPIFHKEVIVYAALVLGICDAAAGMYGEYAGRKKIIFLAEKKSWAGFTAFYTTAFILSICYCRAAGISVNTILFCGILALLPALTELFSYKGSDNFTVPIITALWLLLAKKIEGIDLQIFVLCILLFTALSFFAVYKKWLTLSGAAAALWMALVLYSTGGYKAFIAPGIFLISGSLLSKLNPHPDEKDGRDAKQVFANGIVGAAFMIAYSITGQNSSLAAAIISFGISMSDSVSSELGVYFKRSTYDILSFKKMEPGVSGGISLPGTLAALAGAILIALSAMYLYHFSSAVFLWISLAGFTGMLADSILGSWLQVKYSFPGGHASDKPLPGTIQVKGYNWCGNNTVNFISNLLVTLVFFYILSQMH